MSRIKTYSMMRTHSKYRLAILSLSLLRDLKIKRVTKWICLTRNKKTSMINQLKMESSSVITLKTLCLFSLDTIL